MSRAKKIRLGRLAALMVGAVFLIVGVAWAAHDAGTPQSTPVKQQVIDLPPDAFSDDPRLQAAVNNLQQSPGSQPQGAPPQNSPGATLQPVPQGLPNKN